MGLKWMVFALCLGLLAACDTPSSGAVGTKTTVSARLAELAAPGQDLTDVRIDPKDGCYLYRYKGPVETTYLPLRTAQGNPICSRAQS